MSRLELSIASRYLRSRRGSRAALAHQPDRDRRSAGRRERADPHHRCDERAAARPARKNSRRQPRHSRSQLRRGSQDHRLAVGAGQGAEAARRRDRGAVRTDRSADDRRPRLRGRGVRRRHSAAGARSSRRDHDPAARHSPEISALPAPTASSAASCSASCSRRGSTSGRATRSISSRRAARR